jgi:hypothetical protein
MDRAGNPQLPVRPPLKVAATNAFPQFKSKSKGQEWPSHRWIFADEHNCCFCKKPPDRRDSEPRTLKMSTTDGESYLVSYHEHCFREWLENAEPVAPLSTQMSKGRKSL